MSNDAELKRYVRDEIARQVNIVLCAQAGTTKDQQTETVESLYPGSPAIPDRPVAHPYGFVSRAVAGVISVVVRLGAGPTNRMVVGHRDAARPAVQVGESMLYSSGGWQVYAKNDGIALVSKAGVAMLLDAKGVHIDLGPAGKFSVKNGLGELVALLVKALSTSTAGGFPLIVDPQVLTALQSMQE